LFEADTMVRLVGHFQTILESILVNPEQRLSALPLLTQNERQQLRAWNPTETDYPNDVHLHELFEAQVQATPDAIAVSYEETSWTYYELNRRANQLAHYLRRHGIGPEVLVAICVERSLDMLVGLLGILKAGGAYVPLDPAYPQDRLAFMLTDAQVPVLVTQASLVTRLPQHQTQVVCLDTDWDTIQQESEDNPPSLGTAQDLAYVIYTSGSTGKPKGVQISHQSLVNLLVSMQHQPGLTSQDALLAVTSLSFDIAALELFLPLLVGARLIVASQDVATDGIQLAATLNTSGATLMQATPSTWRMVLEAGWTGNSQLRMLCGGEALPPALATQLLAKGQELWNVYGPTETTIWSTLCKVEAGDAQVSIGHPLANTEVYILDQSLQPVPIGVPGELYIGGDGLARGYLHRLELTAEKFIRHPFSPVPEARLYKTGDLVRYLPDGSIEFLGRLDHQVKLRGHRIELGEIESVLGIHPLVQESVVIVTENTSSDPRLVAYIIAKQAETPPETAELRHFLAEKLPDYMLPSHVVFLDTLPLTPNGKTNRQALPPPDQTRPDLTQTYVAPRTPQ
jgi:amino acid adenylation domain-containing protein